MDDAVLSGCGQAKGIEWAAKADGSGAEVSAGGVASAGRPR
jgi:hypothetical protein